MELTGNMPYLIGWFVAFVALLVIEGLTMQMICVWFAIGALGGLLTATLGLNIYIQLVVGLVLSIILFIATMPFSKKIRKKKGMKGNVERMLEEQGLVTESIDNIKGIGQVKVNGQVWSARSESGELISSETKVSVCRVESTKLIVKRCNQSEQLS